MATTVWGVVEGGRVVPSSALPEGARVEMTLADESPGVPTSERSAPSSIHVAISTFAPEPFEVVEPFDIVIQSDDDGYVASFLEANISSAGDTQHEALENLKDLILMIFQDFEGEEDDSLGPAMLRQRMILLGLIRRKP